MITDRQYNYLIKLLRQWDMEEEVAALETAQPFEQWLKTISQDEASVLISSWLNHVGSESFKKVLTYYGYYSNSKYHFEDFLRTKHAEQYTGTDDDMGDNFNDWLTEIDVEELIGYGNQMANMLLNTNKKDL